jgi:hypothetical protein
VNAESAYPFRETECQGNVAMADELMREEESERIATDMAVVLCQARAMPK